MASLSPTVPALATSGAQQGFKDSVYSTFSAGKQHFRRKPCQDVLFGVLFWLHLLGLWGYVGYRLNAIINDKHMAEELWRGVLTGYFPVLSSAIGIAVACSLLWTVLIRAFPKTMVYSSVFMVVVIQAASVGLLFKSNLPVQAAWAGIGLIFTLLYIWIIWESLAFTALLLETTVSVLMKFCGSLVLSVASAIPGLLIVFAYVAALAIFKHDSVDGDGDKNEVTWLLPLMMFSFFWTWAVLGNIVHTTICGVIGRWYFLSEGGNATGPSLGQALTNSFGSIALGSLIMAFVKMMKMLFRMAEQSAAESDNLVLKIIACILVCIARCIEDLLEFLSTYAFAYVALYGQSFCQAARSSWDLLSTSGLHMIVAYDMSAAVTFLGGLVCAGVTAIGTWAVLKLHGDYKLGGIDVKDTTTTETAYLSFAAGIGLGLFLVMSSAVESGACALLVCFAEEPEVICKHHPALNDRLQELLSQKQAEVAEGS